MADIPFQPEDADEAFARRTRRAVQTLADAPAALQRSAIALWPAQGLQAALAAALQRVAAVLSFDSWAATPALAMRSGAAAPVRQMVFEAPAGSVELRIAPSGPAFVLAGQWLGGAEGGSVELEATDGSAAVQAALDDTGGFRLEGVLGGAYRMTLAVGSDLIELPPLEVGEPAH